MIGKPIEILLIEDDDDDVELTRMALEQGRLLNNLTVLTDGAEALAYLRKQGAYANAKRPDLILLDLNLPKIDGREVLASVKEDQSLRQIPVVVLTTCQSPQDIYAAYKSHANCYITKPVDLQQFVAVIGSIEDFWLTVVKLPFQ